MAQPAWAASAGKDAFVPMPMACPVVSSCDSGVSIVETPIATGSADFSVENPTKKGRDTVDVTLAKLSTDGKTVFLEMPKIAPVMQMGVTYTLRTAKGKDVEGAFYNTINKLGK